MADQEGLSFLHLCVDALNGDQVPTLSKENALTETETSEFHS